MQGTALAVAWGPAGDAPARAQVDKERDALAELPTASPGPRATAANMCYLIFTSGSTGRPKGAVLQHDGSVNFMHFIHRCAADAHALRACHWRSDTCKCACAARRSLNKPVSEQRGAPAPGAWAWGRAPCCRRRPPASTSPLRCEAPGCLPRAER